MQSKACFDLNQKVDHWFQELVNNPSITEADSLELKEHLYEIIDELMEVGLEEEEAFIIASRRLGNIEEFEEEYTQVNYSILQLQKVVVILAGVLLYFFLYYFIIASAKILLVVLQHSEIAPDLNLKRTSMYIIGMHFVVILLTSAIYFSDKHIIKRIDKLNIRPVHAIYFLIGTVFFAITDRLFLAISRNAIGESIKHRGEINIMFDYFSYSFPSLICICFIILYFRYFRKNKV